MSDEELVQKARRLGFIGRGGKIPPETDSQSPVEDLMVQAEDRQRRPSLPIRVWAFVRQHRAKTSIAMAIVTMGAVVTGGYLKARQDRHRR
jgi:hypothetical protein